MNIRIVTAPAAGLIIVGVIAYAATAQTGRGAPVEAMPTINQGSASVDNSRECQPGVVDVACVYL